MKTLQGIAASSGIAIAKAYRLVQPDLSVTNTSVEDVSAELATLERALKKTTEELTMLQQQIAQSLGEEEAAIFGAHLLVATDPELLDPVKQKITDESTNAAYALYEVTTMFADMFDSMDNDYMRERAADIRDVTKRITAHLLGVTLPNLSEIDEQVIIIAEDLTPSDTAQLNRQFVRGFATDSGGRTSHSAIMARSLEIPAVVGISTATEQISHGSLVIIDGFTGAVIIAPDEATLETYRQKAATFASQQTEWAKLVHEPTVSKDGVTVELAANIGTPEDLDSVLINGAEGIGLYRTEFLYMGRETMPTEEEQFEAYKAVLVGMKGKPVLVRTLDIGGDKQLSYLQLEEEANPFLGARAIRLCLARPDMFRIQLRALLRASVYGNLKIMFPMIATLEEFRQAKALLEDERTQLIASGTAVGDIEVGIMVEIPSTAVMADTFAKEVDFFSIGTNDLIQYTFAADRMNEQVSYLYQPYNPAILRLIKMVIDAAHQTGKWVGMCGEMAGDEWAVPLLFGLGLDEFSMSPSSILKTRALIKTLEQPIWQQVAQQALTYTTADEVLALVKETLA